MDATANQPIANSSHEYAHNLQLLAEWLLARPEFDIGHEPNRSYNIFGFYEKEPFLAAAKALGQGKKEFADHKVRLTIDLPFGYVRIDAPRDKVCRLIRAAEYSCDPFLSDAEEKRLGEWL